MGDRSLRIRQHQRRWQLYLLRKLVFEWRKILEGRRHRRRLLLSRTFRAWVRAKASRQGRVEALHDRWVVARAFRAFQTVCDCCFLRCPRRYPPPPRPFLPRMSPPQKPRCGLGVSVLCGPRAVAREEAASRYMFGFRCRVYLVRHRRAAMRLTSLRLTQRIGALLHYKKLARHGLFALITWAQRRRLARLRVAQGTTAYADRMCARAVCLWWDRTTRAVKREARIVSRARAARRLATLGSVLTGLYRVVQQVRLIREAHREFLRFRALRRLQRWRVWAHAKRTPVVHAALCTRRRRALGAALVCWARHVRFAEKSRALTSRRRRDTLTRAFRLMTRLRATAERGRILERRVASALMGRSLGWWGAYAHFSRRRRRLRCLAHMRRWEAFMLDRVRQSLQSRRAVVLRRAILLGGALDAWVAKWQSRAERRREMGEMMARAAGRLQARALARFRIGTALLRGGRRRADVADGVWRERLLSRALGALHRRVVGRRGIRSLAAKARDYNVATVERHVLFKIVKAWRGLCRYRRVCRELGRHVTARRARRTVARIMRTWRAVLRAQLVESENDAVAADWRAVRCAACAVAALVAFGKARRRRRGAMRLATAMHRRWACRVVLARFLWHTQRARRNAKAVGRGGLRAYEHHARVVRSCLAP
jgi:hypothetical protein